MQTDMHSNSLLLCVFMAAQTITPGTQYECAESAYHTIASCVLWYTLHAEQTGLKISLMSLRSALKRLEKIQIAWRLLCSSMLQNPMLIGELSTCTF